MRTVFSALVLEVCFLSDALEYLCMWPRETVTISKLVEAYDCLLVEGCSCMLVEGCSCMLVEGCG